METYFAIMQACRATGTNFKSTLVMVRMYPDRKSVVHMSTMGLIQQGDCDDLK